MGNGSNLNALQHLTQLVLNRYAEQYLVLELDIEDYRQRRKESLESLANRVARQVMRSQKEVKLEPMPSFERKIIHAALAEHGNVKTYSIGEEPHRRLVVAPK